MIYPQQQAGSSSGSAGKRAMPRVTDKKALVRKKGGGGGTKQQLVQWKQKNVKEGLVIVDQEQLSKLIKREPIEKFYKMDPEPFATGLFATVRRCVSRENGSTFAAKFSSRARYGEDCSAEIHHEIALLSLCAPSPRIVRLHDVFETTKEIIIVMEFAPGGDLQTIIDDNSVPFEADVVNFVHQLVEGLVYLHDRKIAHLDIKPQNLVMMADFPNCDVKLCDFEISRVILEGTEIREILGTPDYVAPEILHYEPITMAADMWSLGVTTYVLLTGFTPFGGETDQETFCNISRAQLEFPQELFEDVSADAQDFMKKLLVRDPSARPTAKQLLRHRWLANHSTPKPSSKAPLPDTTTRSTMSQKNLRKYLSKSREALFERVVQQQQHRLNTDLRKSTLVSQYNKTRLCESHMSLVSKSRQDHTLNYLSPSFSRSREKLYGLRSLSKSHEGLDLLKMPGQTGEVPQGGSRRYTKSTTADLSMLPLLRLQEVESSSESLDGGGKHSSDVSRLEETGGDVDPQKKDSEEAKCGAGLKMAATGNDEVEDVVKCCSGLNGNDGKEMIGDEGVVAGKLTDGSYGDETIKACEVLKKSGRQNVDDKAPVASTRVNGTEKADTDLVHSENRHSGCKQQSDKTIGQPMQFHRSNGSLTLEDEVSVNKRLVEGCNRNDKPAEDSAVTWKSNEVNVEESSFCNTNIKNRVEIQRQKSSDENKVTQVPSLLSPQLLISSIESCTKSVAIREPLENVEKPSKDNLSIKSLYDTRNVTIESSNDRRVWNIPSEKESSFVGRKGSDSSSEFLKEEIEKKDTKKIADVNDSMRSVSPSLSCLSHDVTATLALTATPSTTAVSATTTKPDQKSDEEEPKFSVAQLISAYNRHQDIVTKSSLAVTMTANDKEQKIPPLIVEDPTTKFPTGPKALRLFIRDIDIEPSKKTGRRNRTKSYRSLSRSSTQDDLDGEQTTLVRKLQEELSTENLTSKIVDDVNPVNSTAHDKTNNVCNFVVKPPGNVVTQKPPSNQGERRPEHATSYLRSCSISSETSATSGCFTSESSGSASWEEVSGKKEEAPWIQKSGKLVGKSDGNPWGRVCTGTYNRAMEKFGAKDASPAANEKHQQEKPTRKCSLTMVCPTKDDLEGKTRRKSTSIMHHS